MASLVNSRHEQFAQLVARGASATSAYVEAGFMAKNTNVAAANGSRLMRTDNVARRIAELRAEQNVEVMDRLEVSREDIIRRYLAIVQADPSDLVEVKVAACRYCHGVGHDYQWRSEAEFEKAHAAWAKKRDARKVSRTPFGEPEPSSIGGFGYSRHLKPADACPECDGAGEPWVQTRVSEDHPLFAGARTNTDGQVEIKLVDQMRALEALGRITGVFERDNVQKDQSGATLKEALLARMRAVSSLPVRNAEAALPRTCTREPLRDP